MAAANLRRVPAAAAAVAAALEGGRPKDPTDDYWFKADGKSSPARKHFQSSPDCCAAEPARLAGIAGHDEAAGQQVSCRCGGNHTVQPVLAACAGYERPAQAFHHDEG